MKPMCPPVLLLDLCVALVCCLSSCEKPDEEDTTGCAVLGSNRGGASNADTGEYDRIAEAIKSEDVDAVRRVLDEGADVNAQGGYGQMPLHRAAPHASVEMVTLLLDRGAAIDAQDRQKGWSPLHEATNWRNVEVVRLLLERGAKPSLKATHGQTPLDLAKERLEEVKAQLADVSPDALPYVDVDDEVEAIVQLLKSNSAK